MARAIEAGTVIAYRACSGCGRTVQVKVNKNAVAYYYCNGRVSEDGASCSHHEKWSRKKSDEMIDAYTSAQKKTGDTAGDDTGRGALAGTGERPSGDDARATGFGRLRARWGEGSSLVE